MTYGLNLYHSTGDLTYSSSDVTWNQVAAFQVSGNSSSSTTYSVLQDRTVQVVQMFIDPPPTDRKAIAHTISVSGTTVSVSGGNENVLILVLMR